MEVCGKGCQHHESMPEDRWGWSYTKRRQRQKAQYGKEWKTDELKHRCIDVKLQDTEEGRERDASRVQVHGSRGSKTEIIHNVRAVGHSSTAVLCVSQYCPFSMFYGTPCPRIFSTFFRTRTFLCLLSPSIYSAIPPLHFEISAIFL